MFCSHIFHGRQKKERQVRSCFYLVDISIGSELRFGIYGNRKFKKIFQFADLRSVVSTIATGDSDSTQPSRNKLEDASLFHCNILSRPLCPTPIEKEKFIRRREIINKPFLFKKGAMFLLELENYILTKKGIYQFDIDATFWRPYRKSKLIDSFHGEHVIFQLK